MPSPHFKKEKYKWKIQFKFRKIKQENSARY